MYPAKPKPGMPANPDDRHVHRMNVDEARKWAVKACGRMHKAAEATYLPPQRHLRSRVTDKLYQIDKYWPLFAVSTCATPAILRKRADKFARLAKELAELLVLVDAQNKRVSPPPPDPYDFLAKYVPRDAFVLITGSRLHYDMQSFEPGTLICSHPGRPFYNKHQTNIDTRRRDIYKYNATRYANQIAQVQIATFGLANKLRTYAIHHQTITFLERWWARLYTQHNDPREPIHLKSSGALSHVQSRTPP